MIILPTFIILSFSFVPLKSKYTSVIKDWLKCDDIFFTVISSGLQVSLRSVLSLVTNNLMLAIVITTDSSWPYTVHLVDK